MRKFLNKVAPFWPILILICLSLFLAWKNIVPDTFLVGWDSTMPELNIGLNLQRFLFPVWQNYRGLGTTDGMAHGANIVYWLYVALAKIVLPDWMIRYFFQLLFHFLGGLGVYLLLVCEVFPRFQPEGKKKISSLSPSLAALLASLLYLFNFMTIQMFYAPLEVFSIHFFALPWSVWTLLRYLRTGKRKDLLFFGLVQVLTLSQAHVPTVFISYCFALSFFLLGNLLLAKNRKRTLTILISVICINAFWGFPYLYSALDKSADISQSQINQFSTDDIFYRNMAWGDTYSLFTFGGFNLDYFDWNNQTKESQLMMGKWVEQVKTKEYVTISIFMSATGILGALLLLIQVVRKKKWLLMAFPASLLLFTIFLGNNITGIKVISEFFRTAIPFFYQIFRFTFTKFSIGYVFFLSICSGYFWYFIFTRVKSTLLNFLINIPIATVATLALLWSVQLCFQGWFFYPNLRVQIPNDYFQARDYFQKIPSDERVLFLPLNGMWGWTTNDWGYRGSGFFWQMLPQPTVDRAFDAWSLENETLYIQFNKAIQDQNSSQFADLIQKYHIQTVLIDNSAFELGETSDQRNKKADVFRKVFSDLGLEKIQTFGKLEIYSTNSLLENPSSPILINPDYLNKQVMFDPATEDRQNYFQKMTASQTDAQHSDFPFQFLNKNTIESEKITESDDTLSFIISNPKKLRIPEYSAYEKNMLTQISGYTTDTDFMIRVHPLFPEISGNGLTPPPSQIDKEIKIPITAQNKQGIIVEVQGELIEINPNQGLAENQKTISLSLKEITPLKIFSVIPASQKDQTFTYSTLPVKECWYYQDKPWSVHKKDDLTLDSINASACVSQLLAKNTRKGETLLKIDGVFKSTNKQSGRICVRYSNSFGCLNTQDTVSKENGFYSFSTHYTLDDNDYSIDAMNEIQQLDTQEITQYLNITFSSYSFLSSQFIDLQESLEKHEQYYQQLNEQLQEFNEPVTVKISKSVVVSSNELVNSGMSNGLNCDIFDRGQVNKKIGSNDVLYEAQNKAILCDHLYFPTLNQEFTYMIKMNFDSSKGSGLSGYFRNAAASTKDLEFSIPELSQSSLYLPLFPSSQKENFEQGFDLFLSQPSYGSEVNTVQVSDPVILQVPLKWLTHFRTETDEATHYSAKEIDTKNKNFFYISSGYFEKDQVLSMNKAFDRGWIAFNKKWPFKRFEHVKFDGWANGWVIPAGTQEQEIVILYWPQLLEFTGFGMLFLSVLELSTLALRKQRKQVYSPTHQK